MTTAGLFLDSVVSTMESQKRMAERAIEQVSDDDLHKALDAETNSIGVIMKHIAGNMRSRWTDFFTSDGEKPWRKRDGEFMEDGLSRDELMKVWEEGWALCLGVVRSLSEGDLSRTVTIRGEAHTVALALMRQLSHYGYHIGQIMILARHWAGDNWKVLTIPRGKSEEYNQRVWKR